MHSVTTLIDDPRGASIATYHPAWLDEGTCAVVLAELQEARQHFEGGPMLVDGCEVPTPRMVVAFGDDRYAYSDMGESLPWPPALDTVRRRAEQAAGHPFNYALVNWYRNGDDFTGWHSDKVELHVRDTRIGIVSLGASRTLRFRATGHNEPCVEARLAHGSLVWMQGDLQRHYEHAIPPDPGLDDPRFSVTLRHVLTEHAARSTY